MIVGSCLDAIYCRSERFPDFSVRGARGEGAEEEAAIAILYALRGGRLKPASQDDDAAISARLDSSYYLFNEKFNERNMIIGH